MNTTPPPSPSSSSPSSQHENTQMSISTQTPNNTNIKTQTNSPPTVVNNGENLTETDVKQRVFHELGELLTLCRKKRDSHKTNDSEKMKWARIEVSVIECWGHWMPQRYEVNRREVSVSAAVDANELLRQYEPLFNREKQMLSQVLRKDTHNQGSSEE